MILNLLCSDINIECCILWCVVAICATIVICYGLVSIIKAIHCCCLRQKEEAYKKLIESIYLSDINIDGKDYKAEYKKNQLKITKKKGV